MSNALIAAAEVLEKAAAYIEAVEAEKRAVAEAVRAKTAAELQARFSQVTGEELSADVAAKLATAEPDVIAVVEKLAGSLKAPDSLGGPGDVKDTPADPRNAKEAAVQAEDRFAAWLTTDKE